MRQLKPQAIGIYGQLYPVKIGDVFEVKAIEPRPGNAVFYLEREGDRLLVPVYKRDLLPERGPVVAAILAALKTSDLGLTAKQIREEIGAGWNSGSIRKALSRLVNRQREVIRIVADGRAVYRLPRKR